MSTKHRCLFPRGREGPNTNTCLAGCAACFLSLCARLCSHRNWLAAQLTPILLFARPVWVDVMEKMSATGTLNLCDINQAARTTRLGRPSSERLSVIHHRRLSIFYSSPRFSPSFCCTPGTAACVFFCVRVWSRSSLRSNGSFSHTYSLRRPVCTSYSCRCFCCCIVLRICFFTTCKGLGVDRYSSWRIVCESEVGE